MQTQNLTYFITAAEELNITSASAKLFISQQSLSEQIKKLEKKYDAVFFERRPRLRLTKQGERFLEYARQVVAAEQALVADLQRSKAQHTIRLGNSSTRGRHIIKAAIRTFTNLYPEITLSLINSDYNSLIRMLGEGELDAFTASFDPQGAPFNNKVIYISDFIYVCPRELLKKVCSEEHFAQCPEEERIEIMSRIPLTLSPKSYPLRSTLDDFFESRGLTQTIVSEISTANETFGMCAEGRTAAFIPIDSLAEILKRETLDYDLFFYREKSLKEMEPFTICYRDGLDKVHIETLIDLLRKCADDSYEDANAFMKDRL